MDTGLGARLAWARDKAGMNQDDAAEVAESSRAMISRYENGHAEIKTTTLMAFARAYRVNPMWLLTGEGYKWWSPESDTDVERERLKHYMRVVAAWLDDAADSDADLLAVVQPRDEDFLDPPDGKGGGRDLGTSRRASDG